MNGGRPEINNGDYDDLCSEVTALRSQLKRTRRELKQSKATNTQLERQKSKLKERLETMMTIQRLNAERQLRELRDEQDCTQLRKPINVATQPYKEKEQSMLLALA